MSNSNFSSSATGTINDVIEYLTPGGTATLLSARRANQLIRVCNAVRQMKADTSSGLVVTLSDEGIIIDASALVQQPVQTTGAVYPAIFTSDGDNSFNANLLSAVTITNSGGTLTVTGPIVAAIVVAKPYNLQRQCYDGVAWTDPILGAGTGAYVSSSQRTFNGTTQYVDAPYLPGDLVMVTVPQGGTGVVYGGAAVIYQDENVDARDWMALSGTYAVKFTADGDDYFTGSLVTGFTIAGGVISGGTAGAVVKVAKPLALRRSGYDGLTLPALPNSPGGSAAYVDSATRTISGVTQKVSPPYAAGDLMLVTIPQGGTGLTVEGTAVTYQDLNADGREWTAAEFNITDGNNTIRAALSDLSSLTASTASFQPLTLCQGSVNYRAYFLMTPLVAV